MRTSVLPREESKFIDVLYQLVSILLILLSLLLCRSRFGNTVVMDTRVFDAIRFRLSGIQGGDNFSTANCSGFAGDYPRRAGFSGVPWLWRRTNSIPLKACSAFVCRGHQFFPATPPVPCLIIFCSALPYGTHLKQNSLVLPTPPWFNINSQCTRELPG